MKDYKFSVDWTSYNIEFWNLIFEKANIDVTDKLDILELGVFEGRSTVWFSDNVLSHSDSKLYSVDSLVDARQNFETIKYNINLSDNPNKIKLHIMPTDMFFIKFPDLMFDIIYVDADHKKSAVLSDGANAYSRIKPGGIIIFDDYDSTHDPDVKLAVHELEKIWDLKLLGTGYQRAYIKP